MDPQLLEFIRKAKAASETDEEIRSSLVSAGWETQDIEQAFTSFQTSVSNLPTSAPALSQINIMKPSFGKLIVPLVVVVALLLVGITAGYVMLKSPIKTPSSVTNTPKEIPSVSLKDKPSVVSISPQNISPTTIQGQPIVVNNMRNILAYTEAPQSEKPPVLVFYDIAKRQKLPPDPVVEADNNYMIMLGPWSPNGQYLPILAYTGPASTDYVINLYFFDARTLRATKIYSSPSSEENRAWAGTSFSFTSAWLNDTKLVVKDDRNSQGVVTGITYITTSGEIASSSHSTGFRKVSKQLEYSLDMGALGSAVRSVKVGATELGFVPEGDIVGVTDGMLAVLVKPKSMYFDGMADQSVNTELQRQIEELQKLELSEEEISRKALELIQPKGETKLNFYNLEDGKIAQSVSLTEGTWQVQSVLVHPSGNTLITHQTNNAMRVSKHRFVLISPAGEPSTRVLFEEDLQGVGYQPYLSLLAFQGTSFLLNIDGTSVIGIRNGLQDTPENGAVGIDHGIIFMKNINSGEETLVCASNCFDMRIYYPYHLVTRY